jgi:hypothetical protein
LIYELRSYTVRPGKLEEFLSFYREKALPLGLEKLRGRGEPVGHWITRYREVVELEGEYRMVEAEEVNYMLAFPSREKREEFWEDFLGSEEWRSLMPEWATLVSKMDNRILEPTF